MSSRTRNVAKELLKPVNTAAILILGVYTLCWGLWLANPFWNVFTRAPLYNFMSKIAPEWVWGGIAVAAGFAIIHGVFRPSYKALIFGALVGYFHWMVIAIMYFGGDWRNTGGLTALTFSVYSGFIWLNITRNNKNK